MPILSRKISDTTPKWPTAVIGRKTGGRVIAENAVWLYGKVPLSPVTDARSPGEALASGEPVHAVLEEIARTTRVRVNRRSMSKSGYRDVHLLLVNVPTTFTPPPGAVLGSYLSANFADTDVLRRVLLVGVRLQDKLGSEGGLRDAVDSVVETLSTGSVPLSDYDEDHRAMGAIMARAGLLSMTDADFALANAWWNEGKAADTPMLVHDDHLHVFTSTASMHTAQRLVTRDRDDCSDWDLSNHRTLTFATVRDFEIGYPEATSSAAQWASHLIDAGAMAVSIRGKLEPPAVTRAELRRGKKKYSDDINERYAQNKMARAEQEEILGELDELERHYATGGPATLMDCSTIVAVEGKIGLRGYDMSEFATGSGLALSTMVSRQNQALAETWLASPVRANPYLHDLPTTTLAASGLTGLSAVGDRDGAMPGFTEIDRQPAFISPTAASDSDTLPIMSVVGQTGSGKLTHNRTKIPTPFGWTTMGGIRVGDEIFADNGEICTVREIFENKTPVLYNIHLSDGQVITACEDHQWLVSNWQDRNKVHHPKRTAAHSNWRSAQILMSELLSLADRYCDSDMLTSGELLNAMSHLDTSWKARIGVSTALDFVDCPSEYGKRTVDVRRTKKQAKKVDPVVLFPLGPTLDACIAKWKEPGAANAARWSSAFESKIQAAQRMLTEFDSDEELTVAEIARRLIGRGATMSHSSKSTISTYAREAGVHGRAGFAEVTIPLPDTNTSDQNVRVWSAPLAFKHLALRVSMMFSEEPRTFAEQRVLSTKEMLVYGVKKPGHNSEFAIAVTAPLNLPEADLLVDPYVLGMWLGDGTCSGGQLTQGASESCTDASGLTDQRHMLNQLVQAGVDAGITTNSGKTIGTRGLMTNLRRIGVLNNKHIPVAYLRASESQRLALLQGLMDTDGTIDKVGSCELCLCDETLVYDSLELIRSLGIKASITSSDATITELDPDHPGKKRRRVTGTRWRVHFTTDKTVFRLPRKAARLPKEVRETQKWLYITDITPAPSEPGRCITVDSPNHTFLIEGFVPTHNTMVMLYLADQFSRMRAPDGGQTSVIIIDPKQSSSHDAVVEAAGGSVASLDDLIASDGIFDPIRFSKSAASGAELAASMLMSINPWGTSVQNFEMPIQRAIAYGVERGADCIGVALATALADGIAPKEMVDAVFDLATSSPMFRACVGSTNGGQSLRASQGITLIKVGDAHLDLPAPGQDAREVNLNQRIALALVRMMVFGSASALAMRSGVLMLDEAWVMLGAGRTEMERLGRLARSQQVFPILFTQRVTDALNAGLAGYISRGLILPIQDEDEALAACAMFNLEPTPERLGRITARATLGSAGAEDGVAANWNSMRAIRDPRTGEVLRGSIGIYVDLAGRAVPIEICLPTSFLHLASTNPEDIRRRIASQMRDSNGG